MSCADPYIVENHSYGDEPLAVGCGNCAYCVTRKANEWSFRLMQEKKVSSSAYFVTLTYNQIHLPLTDKNYMTLKREDLTQYFFRLRDKHRYHRAEEPRYDQYPGYANLPWHSVMRSKIPWEYKPIKYYAVGEYGSKGNRPHYHAIIFNAKREHIFSSWNNVKSKVDGKVVVHKYGHVHTGHVTQASCRYVMKYMLKGQGFSQKKPLPWPWNGIPQFSVQSKNLGSSYLSDAMVRYHRADPDRNFLSWEGGFKCSMPRYYFNKIWPDECDRIKMVNHIHRRAEEKEEEFERKYGLYSDQVRKQMSRAQANKIISELKRRKL
jgi:hypothetical protein